MKVTCKDCNKAWEPQTPFYLTAILKIAKEHNCVEKYTLNIKIGQCTDTITIDKKIRSNEDIQREIDTLLNNRAKSYSDISKEAMRIQC